MTRFGFHALASAWLFSLIAPLVLFYFLKLKRPRVIIPSLVLWQQVLNDQRVNSPFQRFKRNLLLLLQLLLLIAVATAAMQPYWRGQVSRVRRVPVLMDCSASMAALDKAGGRSRLDEAKERVGKMIDGLLGDQELCLIAFSRTARRCSDFTNNKRLLHEALAGIRIEETPSGVEDALRMTQALARSEPFDEVLLFSDGNVPAQADFELSFKLNYQRLAPAGPNAGITALNAQRTSDGAWDVFISVEGSASEAQSAVIEITRDDQPAGRETVAPALGRPDRVLLTVPGDRACTVRVRLIPDAFDSLACDSAAQIDLPVIRPLWVYCPKTLTACRHALEALPDLRLFPDEGGALTDEYDLLITDRTEDLGLRARTRLTIGVIPAALQPLLAPSREGAHVVDWQRAAPILQHVELADLILMDAPRSNDGVRDADFESRGCEILVHGNAGPLLVQRRDEERMDYHLLFHTDRSTLPYRIGFPILLANVVRQAVAAAGLAEVAAFRTGVLPPLAVGADTACVVTAPDGETRAMTSDKAGLLKGIPAPRTGTYVVACGGSERLRVTAGLLSSAETGLTSVETLQFNEHLTVAAAAAPARTDQALWRAFAWAGFGLLFIEWGVFHRRRWRVAA